MVATDNRTGSLSILDWLSAKQIANLEQAQQQLVAWGEFHLSNLPAQSIIYEEVPKLAKFFEPYFLSQLSNISPAQDTLALKLAYTWVGSWVGLLLCAAHCTAPKGNCVDIKGYLSGCETLMLAMRSLDS